MKNKEILLSIKKITKKLYNPFITINTQEKFSKKILETYNSNYFTNEIEHLNQTKSFYNSFFHNLYFKEILCYLITHSSFINCTFDLKLSEKEDLQFFKNHTFKNCKLYISQDISKKELDFDKEISLFLKKYNITNKSLKIIKTSYSYHLLKRKKVHSNFNMLNIDYLNLEENILPSNPDFFKNLESNIIKDVSFPKVDFSKYDLENIFFENCIFHEDSLIPSELLNGKLKNCILPKIDFPHDTKYHFEYCFIHPKNTFPNDINFFLKGKFNNCIMPRYDYSQYNICNSTFQDCIFHENSILPKAFYEPQNIESLFKIRKMPKKDAKLIARYATIPDKNSFLQTHLSLLTIDELYLIKNIC